MSTIRNELAQAAEELAKKARSTDDPTCAKDWAIADRNRAASDREKREKALQEWEERNKLFRIRMGWG